MNASYEITKVSEIVVIEERRLQLPYFRMQASANAVILLANRSKLKANPGEMR